jgi:hypothetical protein
MVYGSTCLLFWRYGVVVYVSTTLLLVQCDPTHLLWVGVGKGFPFNAQVSNSHDEYNAVATQRMSGRTLRSGATQCVVMRPRRAVHVSQSPLLALSLRNVDVRMTNNNRNFVGQVHNCLVITAADSLKESAQAQERTQRVVVRVCGGCITAHDLLRVLNGCVDGAQRRG